MINQNPIIYKPVLAFTGIPILCPHVSTGRGRNGARQVKNRGFCTPGGPDVMMVL
jgi:hypothetical protein